MALSHLPRSLLLLSFGIVIGTSVTYLINASSRRRQSLSSDIILTEDIVDGVEGLIGNTKLVRIHSLSATEPCTSAVIRRLTRPEHSELPFIARIKASVHRNRQAFAVHAEFLWAIGRRPTVTLNGPGQFARRVLLPHRMTDPRG